MPQQLYIPILTLFAASAFCYVGTHALWTGTGSNRSARPGLRGVFLSLPLIFISCLLTWKGFAWIGISILTTGAVVMLTLGLGVSAISLPENNNLQTGSTRILLPLCLVILLVGMSGELTALHAILIALVAGFCIWSADTIKTVEQKPILLFLVGFSLLCYLGWTYILKISIDSVELPILQRIAPVLAALWILASIGLLVGDVHACVGDTASATVSGTVASLLGIGLPVLILTGSFLSTFPQDPAQHATVIMSQPTWRIDCLLLAVVSGLLFQASSRKTGIGRVEGVFLVAICLIYMMVTIRMVRA